MKTGNDRVASLMERAVNDGVFPGGVLLASMGSTVRFHRAFGKADVMTGQRMEPDSIFDLASLTKPLTTALAVIRLMADGLLEADHSLGSILGPMVGKDKQKVTIDQLLRHTSGLPAHREYFNTVRSPGTPVGRQEMRALLCMEPLVHEPGRREVYSDLGYMFLAWIVEVVSDQRLDRFADKYLYRPLGIEELFFIETGRARQLTGNLAGRLVSTEDCPWRRSVLRGEVHDDNAWAAGGIEGHAGLFGSAASVWNLINEIRRCLAGDGSGVISHELLNRFVIRKGSRERVAGFDTPSREGSSSGRLFSSKAIGHLGFTGTSFWIDPDSGLSVILLTNRVHPSRSNEKIKQFRPVIHDAVAGWLLGSR